MQVLASFSCIILHIIFSIIQKQIISKNVPQSTFQRQQLNTRTGKQTYRDISASNSFRRVCSSASAIVKILTLPENLGVIN